MVFVNARLNAYNDRCTKYFEDLIDADGVGQQGQVIENHITTKC